ncbi:RseA family anti-sigma factor [Roseateles sp.]|uniref:RseA family anti-sigma factor n=1 Tax=Roseateles sp. TaxID=1971397 RepID=UPI0039E788C0
MVSRTDEVLAEALSAVMDGRATPADWAQVNAAWARDPALRDRWALWHATADGLRATELSPLHREPESLLAALHAQLPAAAVAHPRGRDWLAPLAVAASFVALALGVGVLRPAPATQTLVAAAPVPTPRAQGLGGLSFAQTAAGRTLAADAPPEVIDWALALPEPAASHPLP